MYVEVYELSCPRCGAKPGCRCANLAKCEPTWDREAMHTVKRPHAERLARMRQFADRPRWPCNKPGCDGSVKAISVGRHGDPNRPDEMLSSKEGACPKCGWWIGDPAHTITSDEMLADMAADLAATHELVPNPQGPKTKLEASEAPGLTLVGEPDNRDAVFHLVPRTKPPESNPHRQARLKEENRARTASTAGESDV